jgi:signal peptidase I
MTHLSTPDAEKQRHKTLLRRVEWVFLVVFLAGALAVYFTVQRVIVHGRSMEPTLHDGDALIAWKAEARGKLREGNVIVFRDTNGEELIKRIVFVQNDQGTAKPPENVQIPGSARSWKSLFSEYNIAIASGKTASPTPANTIWVMGDNTDNSEDSRVFGPIRRDQIVGVVYIKDIGPE